MGMVFRFPDLKDSSLEVPAWVLAPCYDEIDKKAEIGVCEKYNFKGINLLCVLDELSAEDKKTRDIINIELGNMVWEQNGIFREAIKSLVQNLVHAKQHWPLTDEEEKLLSSLENFKTLKERIDIAVKQLHVAIGQS
jgi:hypothetical protein